jgi:hypothetical protein
MICVACAKRCDPNRSFCRNCGSSVFIDQAAAPRPVSTVAAASVSEPWSSPRSVSQPSPQARRAGQGPRSRSSRAQRPPLTAPAAVGAIAGLLRLIILGVVVWYAGSALLAVPEIRALRDAFRRGDSAEMTSAVQGVRSWLQSLLPNGSGESAVPEPPQRR